MKHIFLIVLMLFSLASCKQKQATNPISLIDFYTTEDLDFSVFDDPKYQKHYNKTYDKNKYFNHYFKVWNEENTKITNEEWNEYFLYDELIKKSPCFGGNYQKHTSQIIEEIKQNLPTDNKPYQNLYGITTNLADLRILPTNEFCLKNIQNAGESYPFDYLQNSTLAIASPVRILSKTNNNLWYFVDSHNNKGWIKANKIALISEKQKTDFQQMNFAITTKDNQIISGENSTIRFNLGTLLPVKNDSLLIPKKSINNSLIWDTISINNPNIKPFPIEFNKTNIKNTIHTLLDSKYMWGGIDGGRDCSSTLKDFYATFGIWLPRNSSQQVKFGTQIGLTGTSKEKTQVVLEKGIPFLSSVFKKGHIMMYVGAKNKNPLIFHNVWGIKAHVKDKELSNISLLRNNYGLKGIHKTNDQGEVQTRYEISRSVITTIEPAHKINALDNFRTEIYMERMKALTIHTLK